MLSTFFTQKLLDFTKKMMRICDGLYSEEDETTMRLLLLTRPAMEEFADAVNELMPGMLVARFKIVVKRHSNSLILVGQRTLMT